MGAQHKASKLEIRNQKLEAYASCTVFLGKKWIQGYCEDCGSARGSIPLRNVQQARANPRRKRRKTDS